MVGIAVAAVVVIGVVAAAGLALVDLIDDATGSQASETADLDTTSAKPVPLLGGDAQSPVAATPVSCAGAGCLGASVVDEPILQPDRYSAIGLTNVAQEPGAHSVSTPSLEHAYAAKDWRGFGGTPAACFFTYVGPPITNGFDDAAVPTDDSIHFTGAHATDDDYSVAHQTVRVFADSAAAEAHMATLDGLIAGCERFELGTGDDLWYANVAPAPALDHPDTVAVVGWTENSKFGRYYSYDVQYANVVVRTALTTWSEVTEEDFRSLITEIATSLSGRPLPL